MKKLLFLSPLFLCSCFPQSSGYYDVIKPKKRIEYYIVEGPWGIPHEFDTLEEAEKFANKAVNKTGNEYTIRGFYR